MRLLVCGGRDFDDTSLMHPLLLEYVYQAGQVTIIEGCARGADRMAETWAIANDQDLVHFPADWDRYGKSAGPIRNRQMLVEGKPDLVIAFGGHRGTANMVEQARHAGVRVIEVRRD